MSSRHFLPFAVGILLGLTLSTFVLYPNKLTNVFSLAKPIKLVDFNGAKGIFLRENYNNSLADDVYKSIRVLCWILTTPENHQTKAIHVKSTWGKRCNKLLFMSTQLDVNIEGIVPLAVTEGRSTLWDKTRSALQYIYNHHFNDFDWFLKADDDSYIVVENLRYLLHQYRAKTSLYIGHRYATKATVDGYNAGGAYVLSKKALEKFVTKLMHNKEACRMQNDGAEDLELGICLQNSTLFVDERDELKQKRFFPAGIYEHLNKKDENISYWYDQMLYYDSKYGGLDCCSDTSIGFHYVTPDEMYILEYLIYRVHPYSFVKNMTEVLPRKLTMREVIESSDVPSNATDFVKHFVYHNFEESEKFA